MCIVRGQPEERGECLEGSRPLSKGSPYRNDGLLYLRGIASFSVVCHHLHLGEAMASASGLRFLEVFAITGSYSVFIFFCLSGYLMAKILDRRYGESNLSSFYYNRALRILPTYYLAVFLTFLLFRHSDNLFDLAIVSFFLFDYVDVPFPNGPLWTLSTEVQFYLISPFLFGGMRKHRWIVPLAFLAPLISKSVYFLGYFPGAHVYRGLDVNLLYFMTGWVSYLCSDRLAKTSVAAALPAVCITLIVLWAGHYAYICNDLECLYKSLLWIFAFPAVLSVVVFLALPSLDREVPRIVGSVNAIVFRLLEFLGLTSYAAYVVHAPIINAKYTGAAGTLLIIYSVAAVIYYGVELPIYRLRK